MKDKIKNQNPWIVFEGRELHLPRWPRFDAWLTRNEWRIIRGLLLFFLVEVIVIVIMVKAL